MTTQRKTLPARGAGTQGAAAQEAGTRARAEALSLLAAAALGVALIWVAGFAEATVVHDFAHDQRHSISFPCH